MSYRPARVTQADVARAIRAAQQCGAGKVRIAPDGYIEIVTEPEPKKSEKEVETEREIPL